MRKNRVRVRKSKDKDIRKLKNPLYLNANLIYSEAKQLLTNPNWKFQIKTGGTLKKLRDCEFRLVISNLTRMEVMQQLRKRDNLTPKRAREVFDEVLKNQKIIELTSLHNSVILTPDLLNRIANTTLDFKDALHLQFAKKHNIPLCTHDKKMKENWSQHPEKGKFYEHVYKPEELIKFTQNHRPK